MDVTYLEQPPNKYTFKMPLLRQWTEKWCKGKVLNLFAGNTCLNVDEIRNDIDINMPAHYHKDAMEFIVEWNGDKFDTVIFDPPYNLRKAREKYEGRYIGLLTKIKNTIINIMNPSAHFISYGYDTTGMGKGRGFKKKAICIVCHSGDHNDTLCLVEEYIQPQIMGL